MSNISQFFKGDSRKKNRKIFHGTNNVAIYWKPPEGVTEVEVHCWGGGGAGQPRSGVSGHGGAGGGYVTHVYPVTPADHFSITVGAQAGTSSVSVPTQSPGSPISATGGENANTSSVPIGGSGAYTIAAGVSTARTFKADGGNGSAGLGGGGAAGSPFGNGRNGLYGGGGIGGAASYGGGGTSGDGNQYHGGNGKTGVSIASTEFSATSVGNDDWFYVDEILGAGGPSAWASGNYPDPMVSQKKLGANGSAGGGGGWPGGHGGILGGGASGTWPLRLPGGNGGLGGGGGGNTAPPGNGNAGAGGGGLVIVYW